VGDFTKILMPVLIGEKRNINLDLFVKYLIILIMNVKSNHINIKVDELPCYIRVHKGTFTAVYTNDENDIQGQLEEANKEILRLKIELRKAKDKLYDKSRDINRMRDDDFNTVNFDRDN